MDTRQKEELVRQEINKVHLLGEMTGDEHLSCSGIAQLYIGEETKKDNTVRFPFSAEVEYTSEFGANLFWYYGNLTIKEDGTVESQVTPKTFGTSFMIPDPYKNLFSDKERTRLAKLVKKVRKELHLNVDEWA